MASRPPRPCAGRSWICWLRMAPTHMFGRRFRWLGTTRSGLRDLEKTASEVGYLILGLSKTLEDVGHARAGMVVDGWQGWVQLPDGGCDGADDRRRERGACPVEPAGRVDRRR